jgi:hypothetical protein
MRAKPSRLYRCIRAKLLDDSFQRREAEADLFEERWIVRDENKSWMLPPKRSEFCIKRNRFVQRLVADWITTFDGCTAYRGGLEENHGIVAPEFRFERCAHRCKILAVSVGPVSSPIYRAPVTKQRASGVERGLHFFEIPLHVKDRSLCVPCSLGIARAREAALKKNRGRLGNDDGSVANLATEQVSCGRFSAARPARKNNATAFRARTFGICSSSLHSLIPQ